MTVILTIWRVVRPILTFGITLPVWLFLAAGIWLWFDKTSAVRVAVNDAVREMAAGAEIAGLKARLDAANQVASFERGKAQALAEANKQFEDARQIAELESERLQNELDQLLRLPVAGDCTVQPDFLDRLRNK